MSNIIILNTPISHRILDHYLKGATKIICADGGANRLMDSGIDRRPDLIIGDLDSIRADTRQYYRGVTLIHDPDQDTTDLEKALSKAEGPVTVLGGLSGRMDQTMFNLHALLKYKLIERIVCHSSILRILSGEHLIKLSIIEDYKGIGIFPVNGKAQVFTKGLKWNLEGEIQFGVFVSACNETENQGREFVINSDSNVYVITQLACDYQLK